MASLAFDKHGKPFKLHRLTRQLAVRVFSNPGGRGSCFPVRDDDGNDVFIDADADYQDFCEAVKGQTGQYRLDQYDEHGEEITGAPPAYAVIRDPRNTAGATDLDPRDAVILQLAESNTALAQTNAEVAKTAMEHFAAVMHATAEILHAPVKPPPAAVDADDHDEDDDDEADDTREPEEPDPWAAWRPILKMAEPLLPKLGELLYAQLVHLVKKSKTPPPAAVTSSAPAEPPAPAPMAAPSVDAAPVGAAAGSSTPSTATPPAAAASMHATSGKSETPATPPRPRAETASASTAPASPASTTTSSARPSTAPASTPTTTASATPTPPAPSTPLAVVAASGEAAPRNAALSPTPDQWEHLHAVRERLSPKERAIAENAIMRMDADVLAQYLAELSTLSVDEAVALIRSMIAKLRPPGSRERG